jgi:hypothetical protein
MRLLTDSSISSDGQQVTLEFFTFDGHTLAIVPVPHSAVRPIMGSREITSARVIG